ncbi:MAG: sugar ABC transporter ATP-binding protein [Lentisphaeria bacterium]|nr:sugar ABC transporter ATP-binding protein [Lentisphaeria bacterium]
MNIRFESIRKAFGVNEVLHGVSFSIDAGQIFALLGENGAGKSTLMNILGGMFPPTEGNIFLDGKAVSFATPNDSMKCGIAFIHQELCPVNDLTVAENIFIGREYRRRFGFLDRKRMNEETVRIFSELKVDIKATDMMRSLDASSKQIVAIARALLFKAKVIIMDEPTTSLTEQEIGRLFELVRRLAAQGVTIIFISHKLNEIKELCTAYAVLRNGSLVGTGKISDVTAADLSELIVGHELAGLAHSAFQAEEKPIILSVEGMSRKNEFEKIAFSVHAGEILGFTGLLGAGHSEIFRSLFGDTPDYSGTVWLEGKKYHAKSTSAAVKAGIAYVPSNRKENAIVPDLSVLTNGTLASLSHFAKFGFVRKERQKAEFKTHSDNFHLKYSDIDDLITTLSGGNQQKVILARWLGRSPKVLVLDNPTQGVDIGAKQEIYEIIRKVAEKGVAVIVISAEGQEIQRLCTRAIVMFHGKIQGELSGERLTEGNIMKLATGVEL